jgi:nitrile hydratase accessory protein
VSGVEPPRANGELVFEQPWESRTFGIALALDARGVLDFEDFRAALIEQIQAAGEGSYYEYWQAALERVLAEGGLVSPAELAARTERHESALRSSHPH